MKYNILISGAYGFIGKNFVSSLLSSSEYNLYLISRNKVTNSTSSFTNVCCDIKDLDSIKIKFKNIEIDFILHFASKSTNEIAEKDPYDTIQSNVVGTLNLLELAREKKVKGFILLSSLSVYGFQKTIPVHESYSLNSTNLYGSSKICCETLLRSYSNLYKIPSIVLRLGMVFGHNDYNFNRLIPTLFKSYKLNKVVKLNSVSNTTVDLIYINDVIVVLKLFLINFINKEINFEIFNLSNGSLVKIEDIVEIMNKLTGVKSIIFYSNKKNTDLFMSNKKINSFLMLKKRTDLIKSLEESFSKYLKSKNE